MVKAARGAINFYTTESPSVSGSFGSEAGSEGASGLTRGSMDGGKNGGRDGGKDGGMDGVDVLRPRRYLGLGGHATADVTGRGRS